ncbi:aminodeoxychorismate/anthranilate synthase component II [Clostridium sp. KNHs205]|jgi:anthranilate synthase component II|uniref:anthranilate synthase component II n=1 Tax=Clostridium sp. KNHs205 TaxID=1449050 RepID=UPI00051BE352|nr:aminodeoxychorismate/anthranilate synthase component II [Clostridium sp. KNHs205]
MILLIDNYDSFSYNLVQLIGAILKERDLQLNQMNHLGVIKGQEAEEIKVVRNDELTIEDIKELHPSHIILSPGPGRPMEAGICEEAVRALKGIYPILGVCLGHQGICEAFGGTITYADTLMHGKQSKVRLDTKSALFQGLEEEVLVGRYHSLAAEQRTLPEELQVIANAADGDIMAVKHRDYEIYGVQFHPESVLTPKGRIMMENFLNI